MKTETDDVKDIRAKWKIPWVYYFESKGGGQYRFTFCDKTIVASKTDAQVSYYRATWHGDSELVVRKWDPADTARELMSALTSRYQFLKLNPNTHRIPDKQLEIQLLDEIEEACKNLI